MQVLIKKASDGTNSCKRQYNLTTRKFLNIFCCWAEATVNPVALLHPSFNFSDENIFDSAQIAQTSTVVTGTARKTTSWH